jgi:hypothetical protein
MPSQDSLHFTRTEIESYLPSGWALATDNPDGEWDAKARSWKTRIVDGGDFEWPLAVKAEDVAKKGRMVALRDAVDSLHRNRLGKPTRGLGLGG